MRELEAGAMCEKRGCRLLQYQEGHSAMITLPSGQSLIAYINKSTIELFTKRLLFGWDLPRCLGSWSFLEVDSNWLELIPSMCNWVRSLTLDYLLEQITQCESLKDAAASVKRGMLDPVRYARSKLDVEMSKMKDDG